MADLRTRNNASSKKSYEKSLERQYADDYEHEMIRHHILTHPDTDAYHWSMVPEEYLYESGYISDFNKHRLERLMRKKDKKEGENRVRDYGFDGLARTCIGSSVVYSGLQAKYYIERQVCAGDIGSFLVMQMALMVNNPLSKGFLYTTSGLQADLAGNVANPSYPIRHVLHSWKHPDARTAPPAPPTQQECDKLLRADQVEALKQLEEKDGINALNTPCRWGKTIVAGHHTKRINAKLVVAIAPLLVSVENLQDRLTCFLPGYSSLLVDSDTGGTTDIEQIKKFLASEGNHIIYSTFKSAVDILSDLLTEYEDKYILGDEIHNANAELCEFIQQFPSGLVMSATMPEEIVNMIDINHTVYIPFAQAIKDGIVVDYTLWLPHLTKASDGSTSVDIEIPVEFSTYDSDLTAKAFYLATVMLKTGSRRCITYLGRQEECDRFIEVVAGIFEIYHGLTIWTGKIDSSISKIKRKEVMEEFQTGQGDVYHILTSVRILDEAVDIPRCDSVFITTVGEHSSDIRMMQRSQRSSTKDSKNPSKHNNIILWAEGWEKCVGALDLLREADPEFHKKVRIADCNYDKSGEVARIESVKEEAIEFGKWEGMKCLTRLEKHLLKIKELQSFYELHKREPRRKSKDIDEKRMAEYIKSIRKEKNRNTLSNDLEKKINENLPWFKWDSLRERHVNNILLIKEFNERNGYLPKTISLDITEARLGRYISNCRSDWVNKELKEEVYELFKEHIPTFTFSVIPFYGKNKLSVEKLSKFHDTFKEPPKYKGKRENENSCYVFLAHLRHDNKTNSIPEYLQRMLEEKCPWLILNPVESRIMEKIMKIKKMYETEKREPTDGRLDSTLEENRLAYFLQDARRSKRKNKLNKYIEESICKHLPWFLWIK